MKAQIMAKYRELRKDHIGLYAGTGARYHHKVTAARALKSARYDITTRERWEQAGDSVRLRIEPDLDADFDNLAGDSFNPDANPDIQPHILERQEKEFLDQVNREGVYGIIGEYRCPCCGEWNQADSCWGFVGDDWHEVDLDIMGATLNAMGR